MTDQDNDFQSISQCASDIVRWILSMALARRISVDRRMDIIRAAERIIALAKAL
jgi:hypothetical protein